MRVLQINTVCGLGSTGRTATELASVLISNGYESYIAYGQGTTDYQNSFKIGSKIENHLHNLCSRVFGLQGYFTKRGTRKFITFIKKINPDIIHLRNLHGNYLNLKILFLYLQRSKIPVVWTLHDCWAFTGKCAHYADVDCIKWQTQCHNCPQVNKYPPSLFFDMSTKMFNEKKRLFTSLERLTIITVSDWLANEVKKSFLSKYPVIRMYNWIDQTVFRPTNGNFRGKYGIPAEKSIVLGVSAGWSSKDNKLREFIRLSELLPDNIKVLLVGSLRNNGCIPSNIIQVPYLKSAGEMAEIYSMADVYVHLSTEDTFGKVIAEAMACGTPAVVYDSTACPEVVGNGCGYVIDKHDVKGVYEAVIKVIAKGKATYSENCIMHVTRKLQF